MKALEHIPFPKTAERVSALYDEEEDALLLGMLGQEYLVRHDGIFLHSKQAPEAHASVILDYLLSTGTAFSMLPWRTINDFSGKPSPEFKKKVEVPVASFATEIISRSNTLLPMMDATISQSIIGSDIAINVRALPKIYLHAELSQETADFPAEMWVLFSNNAKDYLALPNLHLLAELFKERLLSLLRIY